MPMTVLNHLRPARHLLAGITLLAGTLTAAWAAGSTTALDPTIHSPAISADGNWLVYASGAAELLPGKKNDCTYDRGDLSKAACAHVYLRHLPTGKVRRVNLADASLGTDIANGHSEKPVVSANGRYVAFTSRASNLVAGDTNLCTDDYGMTASCSDIFVHDRITGHTEMVSVSSSGVPGNRNSDQPSISANGRYVTFRSGADNLVGRQTSTFHIYVHDRRTRVTSLVSAADDGTPGNERSEDATLSADGRFVVFSSEAGNLVASAGACSTLTYPNCRDVYVRDLKNATTTVASVNSQGYRADAASYSPTISADGRFVAFTSQAQNLEDQVVPRCGGYVYEDDYGCLDIYLHDRNSGMTKLASHSYTGSAGNNDSFSPTISADGRYIGYTSDASNLVANDTALCDIDEYWGTANNCTDAFLYDRVKDTTVKISRKDSGEQISGHSRLIGLTADSRTALFHSDGADVAPGQTYSWWGTYLRDRLLDTHNQADIAITVTAPEKSRLSDDVTFTITTTNHGTINAAPVITGQLLDSADARILKITPTQGSCSVATLFVCRPGSVPAGQSVDIRVTVKAQEAGNVRLRALVNAAPLDGEPTNNRHWATSRITAQ